MLVKTKDLTRSEKLRIERRRNGENQPAAAKRHKVTLAEYRQWERTEEGAPNVKLGRLEDYEACWIERVRGGWTLDDVAEEMGVCRWWLCQMERGNANAERLATYWKNAK